MKTPSNWCIFDGSLITADEPVVPVQARGLMYGDGIFETFRTYSGCTLGLSKHFKRLTSGLKILGINLPAGLTLSSFRLQLLELLREKSLTDKDAIVRLQLWRGDSRGYEPSSTDNVHYSIIASDCPAKFNFPKLVTIQRRRIPNEALPSGYKFTNSINYILASKEANQKGGDDALMQTVEEWISETTIGNIFWIKDSQVFTPSGDCDILPGITRDFVIDLIQRNKKWDIDKGKFFPKELFTAEAVFMTNSIRELLPVQQINNQTFDVENPLFAQLKKSFINFRNGNLELLEG